MGTSEILTSLAMIFVMVIPGFILKKRHIIDERQTQGLSTLIVNVTWPCLVIDAMQLKYSKAIFNNCIYTLVILLGIMLVAFGVSMIVVKLLKLEPSKSGIMSFMLVFGNTGFLGIPIINALYGKSAVFYASIIEMGNDILIFTLGIALIQYSAGVKTKLSFKGFLSPGIVGIIIGFVLFMTDTQLPGSFGKTISIIGSATTPLSMIVIGSQLAELKIKSIVSKDILVTALFKLMLVPLFALLVIRIILGDTSLLATVLIMELAMPVGACTTIFVQQYRGDVDFSTKGILVSTLLCFLTIPVFALMLN